MVRFWKDRKGSVAVYSVFVGTLLIGAAVVGVDYGRLTVLRSQMQNAADAAAMGAAAQLTGMTGARARATAVAMNATQQDSNILDGGGALTVQSPVEFFSAIDPTEVVALGDEDAQFVRVTIVPQNINLLFQPVLDILAQTGDGPQALMVATATATQETIVCDRPHILLCNPDEGGLDDVTDPATMGRQIKMADGGSDPSPGDFKVLCPPINNADADVGNCGSRENMLGLLSQNINDCTTGTIAVIGSTISSSALEGGVNSRFGSGPVPISAPNIVTYPEDAAFADDILGDGDWDPSAYWLANHGAALPPDLANATRYQVYLYELGEEYARNGKETIFPPPSTLPPGFTLVSPASSDIPASGVPSGPVSTDPKRRVMKAAVVDVFVTAPASGGNPIMGELVSPVNPYNSSGVVANVRLVR